MRFQKIYVIYVCMYMYIYIYIYIYISDWIYKELPPNAGTITIV